MSIKEDEEEVFGGTAPDKFIAASDRSIYFGHYPRALGNETSTAL